MLLSETGNRSCRLSNAERNLSRVTNVVLGTFVLLLDVEIEKNRRAEREPAAPRATKTEREAADISFFFLTFFDF